MIDWGLPASESFSGSSLDPRLVGRVDAVDGEALALLQVPVELASKHLEVSLLHPAAVNRDDAELLDEKFRLVIAQDEQVDQADWSQSPLIYDLKNRQHVPRLAPIKHKSS